MSHERRRLPVSTAPVTIELETNSAVERARLARDRQRGADAAQTALLRQKLQAGPDPLEDLLATPALYADLIRLHDRHKIDKLGAPELRSRVYRYLDGPNWRVERALRTLRASPKQRERRAYAMIVAHYTGRTQEEIGRAHGVSRQRAGAIIRWGIRRLRSILETLGAEVEQPSA